MVLKLIYVGGDRAALSMPGESVPKKSLGRPGKRHKICVESNPKPQPSAGGYCDAAMPVRVSYFEVILQAVPALRDLFERVAPEPVEKPLTDRSTGDLIAQIDAGRFIAEIAQFWKVSASELNRWITSDAERISRAQVARKNQAALWDWVALQVLLHTSSDRVELTRAEKIAVHCRWRAEALSRDDYGRAKRVAEVEGSNARELTTRELEIIARDGLPPG